MFGLNVSVFKNNKYVRYGTISTCVVMSIMGVSYLCYNRVKNDVLEKLKNFRNKDEKKKEIIDKTKIELDNEKDNKENN